MLCFFAFEADFSISLFLCDICTLKVYSFSYFIIPSGNMCSSIWQLFYRGYPNEVPGRKGVGGEKNDVKVHFVQRCFYFLTRGFDEIGYERIEQFIQR